MIFKNWEEKVFPYESSPQVVHRCPSWWKATSKNLTQPFRKRKYIELFLRILCGSSSTWPSSCGRPRRSCGWSSAWDLDLMKSTPASSCKWKRDRELFMRGKNGCSISRKRNFWQKLWSKIWYTSCSIQDICVLSMRLPSGVFFQPSPSLSGRLA